MSQTDATTPPQQPRKNWWGRNWKWFLPTVILVPLLLCGGVITLIVGFAANMLYDSVPYQTALKRPRQSPAVQQQLGQPIDAGYLVTGNVHYGTAGDRADLRIPISGPKSEGTIHVKATGNNGQWQYKRMQFMPDGISRSINLLK